MADPTRAASLHTLDFFESAVRHLNFTLVAEESGTSRPSAGPSRRWKRVLWGIRALRVRKAVDVMIQFVFLKAVHAQPARC